MSNQSMTVMEAVAEKYVDTGDRLNPDFIRARRLAIWSHFRSMVSRRTDGLRSLVQLRQSVGPITERHSGPETIEMDRIVGSESRAGDFSRDFLPLKKHLDRRWGRVNTAFHHDVPLPPIRVFELEGDYYVRDGHHRVSVARYHGVKFIRAEVVRLEVCT